MKGKIMKNKIESAKKFVNDNKIAIATASGAVAGVGAMYVATKFNANYIYISKQSVELMESGMSVVTPTWHGLVKVTLERSYK